jgi:hypothetical protein
MTSFKKQANNKENPMKIKSTLLTAICASILLGGCATPEPGKLVYRQDQFASRLEYVRFCQHYELLTYRCHD